MDLQKLQSLFADVGTNTVDIETNTGEIDSKYVYVLISLQLFVLF